MDERSECYVTCACYGEGLRLTYWPEDKLYYLSLWKPRSWGSTSWRQRLRHIWQILKTGEPWEDELCLNQEEAQKVIEFLMAPVTKTRVVLEESPRPYQDEPGLEVPPDGSVPGSR